VRDDGFGVGRLPFEVDDEIELVVVDLDPLRERKIANVLQPIGAERLRTTR
jgi:hypothetical protein